MLDEILIKAIIDSLHNTRPSCTILEQIDKDFTYIFNSIIKKIESLRQIVPYSKQKIRAFTILQYWKARLKQANGNQNATESMQYREQYLD